MTTCHRVEVLVHGKIVVDSVHKEVNGERSLVVRQEPVDMEKEAVENVLQERPHDVTEDKAWGGVQERLRCDLASQHRAKRGGGVDSEQREGVRAVRELDQGAGEDVRRDGEPNCWHHIPRRTREHLQGRDAFKKAVGCDMKRHTSKYHGPNKRGESAI